MRKRRAKKNHHQQNNPSKYYPLSIPAGDAANFSPRKMHSNVNNNNNNVTIARVNSTQACAACKYQRRKCPPDCILAPYFPHDRQRQFLNAHKLFGVSNITKIIKNLDQPEKDAAMRTIIFQSDVRATDPVGGCYRIVRELQRQIDYAKAELEIVLHQLALCRAQAHATCVHANAFHQQMLLQDEALDCNVNCDIFGVDSLNSQDPQGLITYEHQTQFQGHINDTEQFNNFLRNENLQQEVCDSWGMQGSSVSPSVDPATDGIPLTKQLSISESNEYKPFVILPGHEDSHEFGFDSDETIEQRIIQLDGACSEAATLKELDQVTLKEEDESFQCSQDHHGVAATTLFNMVIPLEGAEAT